MTRIFLIFFLFITTSIATAQKVHLNVFAGVANYQGDLQASRFTFSQSHPAVGAGILYEFSEKLYGRMGFTYGKISGDDKKSKLNQDRNLSFSSPVTEVHLGVEYDILNLYERSLTPYVFAGIAGFKYNPSAIDNSGNKILLQPLGTEGQGFVPGRKKYALTQMAIPFGGGIKFALNDNVRIRFEVGLRRLFTDYLDDVSTTYADELELLINNGQQAVDLAFRAYEVKPALSYPAADSKRGNPKSKDWYYFTGIGVSLRLTPAAEGRPKQGKSNLGCPVNVF